MKSGWNPDSRAGNRLPEGHHYFFALIPDPVTANRIHAFAECKLGEIRLHPAERLHLTLAITEQFRSPQPAILDAMARAGAAISCAPFDLRLEMLSGGQHTIALRPRRSIRPLWTLQRQIVRAMAIEAVPLRDGFAFNPHVTLTYRGGSPVQQPIEDQGWAVREFVLIESLVGLGRYVRHGRWPLRAPASAQLSLFSALLP